MTPNAKKSDIHKIDRLYQKHDRRIPRSGAKIVDFGVTPVGHSILSDMEVLLSQYDYRDHVEAELQSVLQKLANDILAQTAGH